MRFLFIAFLCLLHLPTYANVFTPSNSVDALNNSADFLPIDQAFKVQATEDADHNVVIRFSNVTDSPLAPKHLE